MGRETTYSGQRKSRDLRREERKNSKQKKNEQQ